MLLFLLLLLPLFCLLHLLLLLLLPLLLLLLLLLLPLLLLLLLSVLLLLMLLLLLRTPLMQAKVNRAGMISAGLGPKVFYWKRVFRNPVPKMCFYSMEDQGSPISVVELDFRVDVFMQLGCSLLGRRSA